MSMLRGLRIVGVSVTLVALLGGCAGGSSRYMDPTSIDDRNPGVSNTDINLIVNDVVSDLLQSPVLGRYEKPISISVLHIRNKTSEFVDTDALIGDKIVTALLKSGGGIFELIDRKMVEEILNEVELGADGLVNPSEATRIGKMAGATLLMDGELASIRTVDRKTDQRYYRMSLRLTDTERGTLVWSDDKEIKKSTKKGAIKW